MQKYKKYLYLQSNNGNFLRTLQQIHKIEKALALIQDEGLRIKCMKK